MERAKQARGSLRYVPLISVVRCAEFPFSIRVKWGATKGGQMTARFGFHLPASQRRCDCRYRSSRGTSPPTVPVLSIVSIDVQP